MKLASFELLEFLFSRKRREYFVIGLPGSFAEAVTTANYPAGHIIRPTLLKTKTPLEERNFVYGADEKDMLRHTDLKSLLRQTGVEALVPDTYSIPYLEQWAKRNKKQVVCTPYHLQKKFENKLYFDRFLRRHRLPVPQGSILKSEDDAYAMTDFPAVLQTPGSSGSAGTYLVRDHDALVKLIQDTKKIFFPLLSRRFIEGALCIGVSALIGPRKMVFSGLRTQAYFSQKSGKSTYYGIQWIKTSELNPKAIQKLNRSLIKLCTEMQRRKFRGVASFDVMVRDAEIYFIECNPRTGGATPQISFKSELIHGLDFAEEYARATTGDELSAHRPFIPDSVYRGFTLDFSFLADLLPEGLELNALKNGIYSLGSGKLRYVSAKTDDFIKNSNVYIHYVRPEGATLCQKKFIGFMFTHFPLLEITGNQYTFSDEAKKLLKYLEKTLIKQ